MNEYEFKALLEQHLTAIVDALLDYYDPCQLEGSTCRAFPEHNRCCENGYYGKGLCRFFQDGCTRPNPDCKLWLCRTAIQGADPKLTQALTHLSRFALLYGLASHPLIGEPYSGADRQP